MRVLAVRAENSLATLAVIGLITLPLGDILLQTVAGVGIPGASSLTQNLTLWVGLLGAAIATRDGKLLSLATASFLPSGGLRHIAGVIAGAIGAGVAGIFAVGGLSLLLLDREFESTIGAGVPSWIADLILPGGFGLIAGRLAWRASTRWTGRAVAVLGLVGGLWIGMHPEWIEGQAFWPWLAAVLVAAALGAPIFVLLGGVAIMLSLVGGRNPAVAAIRAYEQLTSTALPTLPLFTLAGFLLAEGRTSERLLRLFRAFFGWLPGGTAIVAAALCAFFTSFTGGSGVTILALGGLLLPALIADRYSMRFSLGLITAAGSLGLMFPPSMPLVLYAIVAENVTMENLFIGGFVPGLLMLGLVAAYGMREGMRAGSPRTPFRVPEAAGALWNAKWEVLLPVVVLATLMGGVGVVQSAAMAALYALVVQRFIHRDLASNREVVRVVGDSVALIGGVLIILAAAIGLTDYLVDANVPTQLLDWTKENIHSTPMFLLALNGSLLVSGMIMDIFSAIIVIVPLIVPISQEFSINPVHLGIIFIANLELGYITPPVGLNLFLSSYRFKKPVLEVAVATLPMLAILAIGVLLITYVPWLTLGLLHLMGRG